MSVVIQATVVFAVLWLVVRVVGKRELSQLSAFDLILLVVIGDLIAEGVISEDTSVTGAVIAVSTFCLLTVALSWLSWRFPRAQRALEGIPTLLIRDLDRVEWAVLEQDGSFSFFEREDRG